LNIINLANKSGALYIENAGKTNRTVFQDGKVVNFNADGEDPELLEILLSNGILSRNQYNLLKKRLQKSGEKEAGIYLVNSGYLTQEQILQILENSIAERMRGLFELNEGTFRFELGELPVDDRIPLHLDLENLIVEGARQLQEIEELKAEIPSLDMALKFTDRPGTDIRNYKLSPEEWRVVSYVNPKNSIAQIASTTRLDEVQIRRVVYALLQAGFVMLIRPDGQPVKWTGKQFPTDKPDEQRSLIKRLMSRIRSIKD
jgi:hypothetical protein